MPSGKWDFRNGIWIKDTVMPLQDRVWDNARTNLYRFQCFNALSFSILIGAPVVLLTTWLGGGSRAVGWITSIMPFMAILQIPSTYYIGRLGYRRAMLAGWSARTMIIIPFVLIPFMKDVWPPERLIFLLCLSLFGWSLLRGLANAAWLPWIKALVPEEQRGRYFAGENVYIQMMCLVNFILAGIVLGHNPTRFRFSLLYAISLAAALVSLGYLKKVPTPQIPEGESPGKSVWSQLVEAVRHNDYMKFLVFCLFITIANSGFESFTVLYLKRDTTLDYRAILWLGAFSSAAMVLILNFSGRILDRFGSRPVLNLCMAATILYFAIWFGLTQSVLPAVMPLLIAMYFFYGLVRATLWIAISRLTLLSVPGGSGLVHLALYTTVTGLLGGAVPLAWGYGLDRIPHGILHPFSWFFLGGMAVNLVAFILLGRLREDNASSTKEMALALLLLPTRSLVNLMGYAPRSTQLSARPPAEDQDDKDSPDAAETRARKSAR